MRTLTIAKIIGIFKIFKRGEGDGMKQSTITL